MKRYTLVTLLTLLLMYVVCPTQVEARERQSGWCEKGNVSVTVPSTTGSGTQKFQQSYPSCTVTVYAAGTVNVSTIFSDNVGTAKANPFTADAQGYWFFYADDGRYDIKFSGGGISSPFTLGDYLLDDAAFFGVTYTTVTFSATPAFNITTANYFAMTLTGNVTSSTISGTPSTGQLIGFRLCQDATGGRTFAWPASFLRPPTIASALNACTNPTFFYDGTNWRPFAGTGDSLVLDGTVRGPRPYADIRAYGAVGDNVTDDTAAIQAAIDATGVGASATFTTSVGPQNCSSAATTGVGIAWTNPANGCGEDDITTDSTLTASQSTATLRTTGFGFSVPTGATVLGITSQVNRKVLALFAGRIQDTTIQLLKAGVPVGSNKAQVVDWPTSLQYASYGGTADLWGTTWTPAEINAANFGLDVKASEVGGAATQSAQVDNVRILVTYSITGNFGGGVAVCTTGRYKVSSTLDIGDSISGAVAFVGAGPTNCVLETTSATADILRVNPTTVGIEGVSISGVGFQSSVARTAGSAILITTSALNQPTQVRIKDIDIRKNQFSGITVNAARWIEIESVRCQNITGACIDLVGSAGLPVDDVHVRNVVSEFGTATLGMLRIGSYVREANFTNVLLIGGEDTGPGLVNILDTAALGNDSRPQLLYFTNLETFSSAVRGMQIGNVNVASFNYSFFSNTTGTQGEGVKINGGDEIHFTDSKFTYNAGPGLWINGGTNVWVTGSSIASNSLNPTNTNSGIKVSAGVVDFHIVGNTFIRTTDAGTFQKYSIEVLAGGSDRYTIIGNDMRGSATAALSDGGTGSIKTFTGNIPQLAVENNIATLFSVQQLSVATGVQADAAGFKHIRTTAGCATAATAGAVCNTTITWTTAFADTNYTVECQGVGITSGVPADGGVHTKVAASIQFRTVAVTAAAAQFTNISCVAQHD